jgi:RPA family protein
MIGTVGCGLGPPQVINLMKEIDVLRDAISTPEKSRAYLAEVKAELAKIAAENTRHDWLIAAAAQTEKDKIASAAAAKQAAIDRTAAEAALREAKEIRERMRKVLQLAQQPLPGAAA